MDLLTRRLTLAHAIEGSASLTAAWLMLSHAWAPERIFGVVVALLVVALVVRLGHLFALIGSRSPSHIRTVALATGVGMVGWIALIVLFAIRMFYPDVEIPQAYFATAFAVHMTGVGIALIKLRDDDSFEM